MVASRTVQHKVQNYDSTDVERPAGERWVTMSNALTRAGHGLTLSEKRIVAAAVSKLDSRRALGPGEAPVTKITAAEFAETFAVNMDTAYDQLQAATKQLYNRSITFYEAAHRRNGRPIEPTKVLMRWVGSVKYHKGEGWVELHWWHALLPNLMGLRKQFTSYQLQQASALRSGYSWKLLELLTRFESNGWAEYAIEDFCASMDATEKQRADFNNIKRRMIEPAVKELIEKDGWLIQWRPVKAGRKVRAVRFEFIRNPQATLPGMRSAQQGDAAERAELERCGQMRLDVDTEAKMVKIREQIKMMEEQLAHLKAAGTPAYDVNELSPEWQERLRNAPHLKHGEPLPRETMKEGETAIIDEPDGSQFKVVKRKGRIVKA
jgi:plasmid replication initiation protein